MARFLLLIFILGSWGCSSVSVVQQHDYPTPSLPSRVYVEPFSVRGPEFFVNRRGSALEGFTKDLQASLQSAVVARFLKGGMRAVAVRSPEFYPGEGDWVIQGEFVRVVEGSRAARSSIGFGLGASKVKIYVRVYAIAAGRPDRLVMSFWAEGGSNAEPGGAYCPPWTLPRALYVALTSGVSYDLNRAARQIVYAVFERIEKEGGLPSPFPPPKRPLVYFWESYL